MAKSLVDEVCKLLGVEVEERFKVSNNNYVTRNLYYIDKYGDVCLIKNDNESDGKKQGLVRLSDLINGCYEVIKLPWKPKLHSMFWTFESVDGILRVTSRHWNNDTTHLLSYKAGWVFKTKEEAEQALPAAANEFNLDYNL